MPGNLAEFQGALRAVPTGGGPQISKLFTPGDWLEVRERVADPLSIVSGQFERRCEVSGSWHADHLHMFDYSLSTRLAGAHGSFDIAGRDYRALGRLLFVPAGQHYRSKGGPGRQRSLFLFLWARPGDEDEAVIDGGMSSGVDHCLDLRNPDVQTLLTRIEREVHQPDFASPLMLEGLGLSLLAEVARLIRRLAPPRTRKGGLPRWRLDRIEERVRTSTDQPSLAELAQICGISRRHLQRAFHQETGKSLSMHIQSLILERAKTLLEQSRDPIALVARQVGFSSISAFSTAFKRHVGHSPSEYRAFFR